jgi:hypothetical protein
MPLRLVAAIVLSVALVGGAASARSVGHLPRHNHFHFPRPHLGHHTGRHSSGRRMH